MQQLSILSLWKYFVLQAKQTAFPAVVNNIDSSSTTLTCAKGLIREDHPPLVTITQLIYMEKALTTQVNCKISNLGNRDASNI